MTDRRPHVLPTAAIAPLTTEPAAPGTPDPVQPRRTPQEDHVPTPTAPGLDALVQATMAGSSRPDRDPVSLRIRRDLATAARSQAQLEGVSLQELYDAALLAHLNPAILKTVRTRLGLENTGGEQR